MMVTGGASAITVGVNGPVNSIEENRGEGRGFGPFLVSITEGNSFKVGHRGVSFFVFGGIFFLCLVVTSEVEEGDSSYGCYISWYMWKDGERKGCREL